MVPEGPGCQHAFQCYLTTHSQPEALRGHTDPAQIKSCLCPANCYHKRWRGNITVLSVSVCHVGGPGSCPARSACHRKVEFYHCAIDSFLPVPTYGSNKGRPSVIMAV